MLHKPSFSWAMMLVFFLLTVRTGVADSFTIYSTGQDGTKLLAINSQTGVATVVGTLGISGAVGLTFNADGTLLYTVANSYPPGSSNTTIEQLATINPLTGQATLIGSPFPFRVGIMPMAVSSTGTIFAAGTSTASPVSLANTLLTIDPVTGQPTKVGAFGVPGMMDFAFNPNGTLYGATQTALYTINTSTGAATLVHAFSGVSGVMGITFDAQGNLFATNFSATSSLYSVNLTTGTATLIGATGVPDVHSADVRPVPEPATLVLFSSGFVGILGRLRRRRPNRRNISTLLS